jgi:hypothetical protein
MRSIAMLMYVQAATASRRRRPIVAGAFLVLLLFPVADCAVPPGIDCPKWVTMMIASGVASLKQGDVAAARRYLTAAYECGMSKDSMHYFAAELFLASGAIDTALTFNFAIERAGHLSRQLYLEQRVRIFRAIGWHRAADSLSALYSKYGRHDLSLTAAVYRSGLAIGDIMFMPQLYPFSFPGVDIDDLGRCGLSWRWTRYNAGPLRYTSCHYRHTTVSMKKTIP